MTSSSSITTAQILAINYSFGDMRGIYRSRKCLFINEATQRQLGYLRDEFLGKPFEKYIDAHDITNAIHFYQNCELADSQTQIKPAIFRFISKSGKTIVFQLKAVCLRNFAGMDDPNDPNPLVKISFQDVTHLQSHIKNMGHELKNLLLPVKHIQGLTKDTIAQFQQSLLGENLSKETIEKYTAYLGAISTFSRYSCAKVNAAVERCNREIKHFANAGRVMLQTKPVKLFSILEELIEHRRCEAQFLDIAFHATELPQIEGLYVLTDIQQLNSVLENLLSNAQRATEMNNDQTKREYYFSVVQNNAAPGRLELSFKVADKGKGFCNQKGEILQIKRVTYETISPQLKVIQNGLGLNYSAEIVKMMGGELLVSNGVNESIDIHPKTIVEFTLSFEIVSIMRSPARLQRALITSSSLGAENLFAQPLEILLVEDVSVNAKLFIHNFKKYHCNFTVASSSEEALKLCNERRFGLILMDFGLGHGLSGPETTRAILENRTSKNRDVPILGMTSAHDDDIPIGIDAGMCDVIKKGESFKNVVSTINNHLVDQQLLIKPNVSSDNPNEEKGDRAEHLNLYINSLSQLPGMVNLTPSSSDSSSPKPAIHNPLSSRHMNSAAKLSSLAVVSGPSIALQGMDYSQPLPLPAIPDAVDASKDFRENGRTVTLTASGDSVSFDDIMKKNSHEKKSKTKDTSSANPITNKGDGGSCCIIS